MLIDMICDLCYYLFVFVMLVLNGCLYFGYIVGLYLWFDMFVCYLCSCGEVVCIVCVSDLYDFYILLCVG